VGSFFGFGTIINPFNGTIDEIRIYNRSLSSEQILKNFREGQAGRQPLTIVSQETSVGDVWQVCATPNNQLQDGDTTCSNNVTILPSEAACGQTLMQTTSLNASQTFASNGTCFTLGANNIALNCNGTTISGNGTGVGILAIGRTNVSIINCTISGFEQGIFLNATNSSRIADSRLVSNSQGVRVLSGSFSNVTRNRITSNSVGVLLNSSGNNTIFDNNMSSNTINAQDDGLNNWNTSVIAGTNIIGRANISGNFWSDYTGQDLPPTDGFGDTSLPHNSSGGISSGGDFRPIRIPNTFTAPSDNLTLTFVGSVSGNLTSGSNLSTIENVTVTNTASNLTILEIEIDASNGTVVLPRIEISTDNTIVAVNVSNASNVGMTFFLFLPDQGKSVFVCPNVTTVATVNLSCSGLLSWSVAETAGNVTKNGISVVDQGDILKIGPLSGTGIALGTLATLEISDETDDGAFRRVNDDVTFTARYASNVNGSAIAGATCTLNIEGRSVAMGFGGSSYTATTPVRSSGSVPWSVTCSQISFETLTATDDASVSPSGVAPSVALVSPQTNYFTADNKIRFECRTGFPPAYVELYTTINGPIEPVANLTLVDNRALGTVADFPEGSFKWSCRAVSLGGVSAFAEELRDFTVVAAPPLPIAPTPPAQPPAAPPAPIACGNGICGEGEDILSCPADCLVLPEITPEVAIAIGGGTIALALAATLAYRRSKARKLTMFRRRIRRKAERRR
jgi:parallel beta-helix repeat protein